MVILTIGPVACILLSLLPTTVHSRNIHRHRHLHREYAQRNATPVIARFLPVSTPSTRMHTVSDGKALLHDIKEVEADLLHQSAEISKLLNNVERLESQLCNAQPISTAGEQLTNITPIPVRSTSITAASEARVISSFTCYAPGPIGGPIPCPTTSPTPTMTTFSVQTLPRSAPYGKYNQTSRGYENSPAGSGYVRTTTIASTITLQHATRTPSPTSSSGSNRPMYTFNAQATDNVAVYYGQTPSTKAGGLINLCQDVNVDIVILAFVYDFSGANGYPSAEFGPACWASPWAQAPGLANCSALAPEIAACQNIGKKVLVSLGGAVGDSNLVSASQAQAFAIMLWNLFGAGTNNSGIRPFGRSIVVDGFDIDNENNNPAYYDTFAVALRQQFAQDPSKTYYLSAAPQCPMPDASIPTRLMYEADFVWVQFYNNPSCNLATSGFRSSFVSWSQTLAAGSGMPRNPRLYIGAPGASVGAGSGYVPGYNLSSIVDQALRLNVSNMGGIMLWDGTEAMANIDSTGVNYLQYAKSALEL